MGKLNAGNYGGANLPKLTPEDLDGANAAVLTIQSAEEGRIPDRYAPGGARPVLRVYFREFPESVYYMNPAGVTACIEEFGAYTEDWAGKSLPLVVKNTENPTTGRPVVALHVAPRSEWAGIMDGTGEVEEARSSRSSTRGSSRSSTPADTDTESEAPKRGPGSRRGRPRTRK